MWNQTGAQAYTYSFNGGWDSIVQLDRDVYINSGAKPGYAKYTYPHPLAKDDTPTGNVDDDETPLQIKEFNKEIIFIFIYSYLYFISQIIFKKLKTSCNCLIHIQIFKLS